MRTGEWRGRPACLTSSTRWGLQVVQVTLCNMLTSMCSFAATHVCLAVRHYTNRLQCSTAMLDNADPWRFMDLFAGTACAATWHTEWQGGMRPAASTAVCAWQSSCHSVCCPVTAHQPAQECAGLRYAADAALRSPCALVTTQAHTGAAASGAAAAMYRAAVTPRMASEIAISSRARQHQQVLEGAGNTLPHAQAWQARRTRGSGSSSSSFRRTGMAATNGCSVHVQRFLADPLAADHSLARG